MIVLVVEWLKSNHSHVNEGPRRPNRSTNSAGGELPRAEAPRADSGDKPPTTPVSAPRVDQTTGALSVVFPFLFLRFFCSLLLSCLLFSGSDDQKAAHQGVLHESNMNIM